jgi:hypothetical protein
VKKNKADGSSARDRHCLLVGGQFRLTWIVNACPLAIRAILRSTQDQLEVTLALAVRALLLLMILSHGDFSFPILFCVFPFLEFRYFSDYSVWSYYSRRRTFCKRRFLVKKTEKTAM